MMRRRDNLEELLGPGPDDKAAHDAAAGDPILESQLEMHRLLSETVARRPAPEVSTGFDRALARRLRRYPARRPLRGRARVLMALYWLAFAVVVGIVLAEIDLPLPPVQPWTVALWSLLVPASYALPLAWYRSRPKPQWLPL